MDQLFTAFFGFLPFRLSPFTFPFPFPFPFPFLSQFSSLFHLLFPSFLYFPSSLHCTDFLSSTNVLSLRVGVIYALYLLYYGQPSNFPKAPIRVTPESWKQLLELETMTIQQEIAEAVYVFHKLRADDAFVFTAFLPSKILRKSGSLSEDYEDDR